MTERTKKVSDRTSSRDGESSMPLTQSNPQGRAVDESSRTARDIDSILDEIDDVLEANAEDFVRNYVQKGGE
jgi:ubiquitin-like protein Pup